MTFAQVLQWLEKHEAEAKAFAQEALRQDQLEFAGVWHATVKFLRLERSYLLSLQPKGPKTKIPPPDPSRFQIVMPTKRNSLKEPLSD